ncbi:(2Fe-2S)-binding protein [Halorhodospira halochloris]|uniref:Bacterioferritin-associated ferredoxin n=1 Tax=Halorhodospira halochloris TaxID=1052 RepID=A0A2Z6EZU1_HALHR|nr:(2Fe-2S)-binding protein [Halorhodospira halochloris]MBK1652426.1 hypothetical protein [Halorhodospira halochloris]MCG5547499.1 (2Fe-2S)-binding protein [Halorhodospira halochloris]BBE11167.1 (2Fe-2S)-binding protein [Halorhodospira halochloris]
MYVCICKAVTDGQIKEAVATGSASVKDLKSRLGVMDCCGKCAAHVSKVVGECSACQQKAEKECLT